MEELKDASIHHTAIKVSSEIKNMKLYSQLYKTVQVNNAWDEMSLGIHALVLIMFFFCFQLEIGLLTGC